MNENKQQHISSHFADRRQTLDSKCLTTSIPQTEDSVNPNSSTWSPTPQALRSFYTLYIALLPSSPRSETLLHHGRISCGSALSPPAVCPYPIWRDTSPTRARTLSNILFEAILGPLERTLNSSPADHSPLSAKSRCHVGAPSSVRGTATATILRTAPRPQTR